MGLSAISNGATCPGKNGGYGGSAASSSLGSAAGGGQPTSSTQSTSPPPSFTGLDLQRAFLTFLLGK